MEALAAKMLARIDAQRHRGPGRGGPGRRRTRGTQLAVCSWCGQAYMAKTLRDGGGFCGGPNWTVGSTIFEMWLAPTGSLGSAIPRL